MTKILNEELIYEVLSLVLEIPKGSVATYGQIADLINRPRNARLIGKILSMSEYYGDYPCHRVVNHNGRIAPHFLEQKELLVNENVEFKDSTHVNLKQHKWKIS
ncbi:MAG: methylated-DNA--[protein]-cysteine S-methyltransferase [Bacilli bacterium]|nr:methylated-DNA--[protein]-cysteine S-methyltransferase [Bacilli bacterium]